MQNISLRSFIPYSIGSIRECLCTIKYLPGVKIKTLWQRRVPAPLTMSPHPFNLGLFGCRIDYKRFEEAGAKIGRASRNPSPEVCSPSHYDRRSAEQTLGALQACGRRFSAREHTVPAPACKKGPSTARDWRRKRHHRPMMFLQVEFAEIKLIKRMGLVDRGPRRLPRQTCPRFAATDSQLETDHRLHHCSSSDLR